MPEVTPRATAITETVVMPMPDADPETLAAWIEQARVLIQRHPSLTGALALERVLAPNVPCEQPALQNTLRMLALNLEDVGLEDDLQFVRRLQQTLPNVFWR